MCINLYRSRTLYFRPCIALLYISIVIQGISLSVSGKVLLFLAKTAGIFTLTGIFSHARTLTGAAF